MGCPVAVAVDPSCMQRRSAEGRRDRLRVMWAMCKRIGGRGRMLGCSSSVEGRGRSGAEIHTFVRWG